jgi:hypothetical protein
MRFRFSLVCVALAGFAFANGFSPVARAADPKAKGAKKKGDDLSEDKSGIGKTLSWEEKVMGPDDKKSELDKIKQAQAINKAAAEKAEREKAANAAREAKEREAAAKAGPTTQKRGGDVALPTLPDEGPGAGKGKPQHTEVSPKLETAAAQAPPPALKPADDKFIDKLLKEESGPKKKRASAAEDKALVDMLATEKPSKAAGGKKGKKDGVDDLLSEAEKAAPVPETKVKHETPEWAKPEIRERAPAPVIAAPAPKEKPNDGIIRVVQGAAGSSPSSGSAKPAVATTTSTRTAAPPPGSGTRKMAGVVNSRPGEWADPFSDPSPRKGKVAAQRQVVEDDEDERPVRRAAAVAPAPAKREASRSAGGSSDWDDPFSDGSRKTTGTRRAAPVEAPKPAAKPAPARGRGNGKSSWDDPFTADTPAAKPGRPVAASRAPAAKSDSKKLGATPTATHRAVAAAPAADEGGGAKAQGRWGVLKKRR